MSLSSRAITAFNREGIFDITPESAKKALEAKVITEASRNVGRATWSEITRFAGINYDIPYDVIPSGMSLRDYFAGQALAGIISQPDERSYGAPNIQTFEEWRADIHLEDSEAAYRIADAMLAARERKEDE